MDFYELKDVIFEVKVLSKGFILERIDNVNLNLLINFNRKIKKGFIE